MPNQREQKTAATGAPGTGNPRGTERQTLTLRAAAAWQQLGLVWSWLIQQTRRIGTNAAERLRTTTPNRADLNTKNKRVTDQLSADARAVVAVLGNRDTYRNAWNRVTTAFRTLIAVLGNRDTYLTVGRNIRSTYRSGAAVLGDRATYTKAWGHGTSAYRSTRAVLGNRDTYANAYRATRAAVTDPATTWHNLSRATATAAAGVRANLTQTHMWRAAATLSVAAILSLGILGLNAPNPTPTSNIAVADAAAEDDADRADRSNDRAAEEEPAEADTKADDQAAPETQAAEEKADPKPVAGLDKTQMANAVTVVEVGKEMGISKRGQAVALVTAMQETKFHNYASSVLPESQNYPFDKIGSDHDSVGIFQQRPSMGWGSVKQCMDPEYASAAFYKSLKRVSGWEDMPLTVAAQTVQGSAFPDAYAQWESTANAILDEVY